MIDIKIFLGEKVFFIFINLGNKIKIIILVKKRKLI